MAAANTLDDDRRGRRRYIYACRMPHQCREGERERERERHVGSRKKIRCWLPFWHLTHIHSVSMFRISPPKRTQRVYGSWPMALATRARVGIPWHSLPPLILEADGQTDILSNQFHSDPPSSTPISHSHLSPLSLSSPPQLHSIFRSIRAVSSVGFNPPEAIKVSTPTMRRDARKDGGTV